MLTCWNNNSASLMDTHLGNTERSLQGKVWARSPSRPPRLALGVLTQYILSFWRDNSHSFWGQHNGPSGFSDPPVAQKVEHTFSSAVSLLGVTRQEQNQSLFVQLGPKSNPHVPSFTKHSSSTSPPSGAPFSGCVCTSLSACLGTIHGVAPETPSVFPKALWHKTAALHLQKGAQHRWESTFLVVSTQRWQDRIQSAKLRQTPVNYEIHCLVICGPWAEDLLTAWASIYWALLFCPFSFFLLPGKHFKSMISFNFSLQTRETEIINPIFQTGKLKLGEVV